MENIDFFGNQNSQKFIDCNPYLMLRVYRIDVYVDKWNLRTAETSSAKTCLERFKPRNVSSRSSICDAMSSTVCFLFVALDPRRAASFAVRRSRPDTPLRHSATTLTSTSIVGWTSRWSSTLCRQCRRRDCKDSCHDQTRSGTSASWTCPRAPIYAKA